MLKDVDVWCRARLTRKCSSSVNARSEPVDAKPCAFDVFPESVQFLPMLKAWPAAGHYIGPAELQLSTPVDRKHKPATWSAHASSRFTVTSALSWHSPAV